MNARTTLRAAAGLLAVSLAAGALPAQNPAATPDSTLHLSLGDAVRLAASESPVAEAGRLRAEQAEARLRQSRAALLPDITAASGRQTRTFNTAEFGFALPGIDPAGEIIGPVTVWDTRASARMNLLDLASISRVRAARTAASASRAESEAASENASSLAAQAYLRAFRANATLDARAADSALAADLLGIAQAQLRAGTGVALDVTRAEAQAAGVRAQLIAARAERDRAALDLVRVLGLPLTARVELVERAGEPVPDETLAAEDEAVRRALETRPDLKAAERQLGAARQQVAATRAERLPSLGLVAADGFIGPDLGNLKNTYAYGVQLSLPLFDGFRREGRIQEQQAIANEIDVRRRDLEHQVAIEVRAARLDLTAAREQLAAARERLRLGEQEVAQARDRFRAGVSGNADVITASLSLTAARTQAIDAETQLRNARVTLARAEGRVRELR
jgi:outer membrane protein